MPQTSSNNSSSNTNTVQSTVWTVLQGDLSTLPSVDRRTLQAVAKALKVKANGRTGDILRGIQRTFDTPAHVKVRRLHASCRDCVCCFVIVHVGLRLANFWATSYLFYAPPWR